MKYPLREDFRYIQAPLDLESSDLPFNYAPQYEEEKQKMVDRIIHSETGACFLLTGYRGVGKTTFVDKVLIEAKEFKPNILPIKFNICKNLTEKQLMHQIIKGLYEELNDKIENSDIKEKIHEAYLRTLLNISIESDSLKKDIVSKTVSTGMTAQVTGWLLSLATKVGLSIQGKRSKKDENLERAVRQATYLDYDAKSAEGDFLDIAKSITKLDKKERPFLIFIIDELDKLTGNEKGRSQEEIQGILMNLKNVLSAPGIVFIIIAGIDFYDQVQKDKEEEDSLYQSIFSYDFYLSKDWEIGDRLLKHFLNDYESNGDDNELYLFSNYIVFHSNGVIRNAIYTFNRFIIWEGKNGQHHLSLDNDPEVEYYGLLNKSLTKFLVVDDAISKCINRKLSIRVRDRLIDIIYRNIDEVLGAKFKENKFENILDKKFLTQEIECIKNKIIQRFLNDNWIDKYIYQNHGNLILSRDKLKLKAKIIPYFEQIENDQRKDLEKEIIELKKRIREYFNENKEPTEIVEIADRLLNISPEDEEVRGYLYELINDGYAYAEEILKKHSVNLGEEVNE